MKEYTYTLFLRNPEDGKTQNGTITIKHEGFISLKELSQTLYHHKELSSDYALISMMIVSVEDVNDE